MDMSWSRLLRKIYHVRTVDCNFFPPSCMIIWSWSSWSKPSKCRNSFEGRVWYITAYSTVFEKKYQNAVLKRAQLHIHTMGTLCACFANLLVALELLQIRKYVYSCTHTANLVVHCNVWQSCAYTPVDDFIDLREACKILLTSWFTSTLLVKTFVWISSQSAHADKSVFGIKVWADALMFDAENCWSWEGDAIVHI